MYFDWGWPQINRKEAFTPAQVHVDVEPWQLHEILEWPEMMWSSFEALILLDDGIVILYM